MTRIFRPVFVIFGLLVLLTGIAYPLLITGVSQVVFPYQANGSLIVFDGQVVGSELIGQQFSDPKYFWGRLSDTGSTPYDASNSAGSNLGVLDARLQQQVQDRLTALKTADPGNTQPVPVDLVTASASGLDPDISLAAAEYQAPRVARLRSLSLSQVQTLIDRCTTGRFLGFLGEARVNVLRLNLALDALQ